MVNNDDGGQQQQNTTVVMKDPNFENKNLSSFLHITHQPLPTIFVQLIVSNTGAAVLPMVSTATVVFFLLVAINPFIILPTTSFVLFLHPTSSPQRPRTAPSKTITAKQQYHGRSRVFSTSLHNSNSNTSSNNSDYNTSMVPRISKTSLVFVYGTLKHGFQNHHRVLAPLSKHWKVVSQQASLPINESSRLFVDLYYIPYLVLEDEPTLPAAYFSPPQPTRMVRGEILEVDAKVLQALDELEGVSQGRYFRTEVLVQVDNSSRKTLPCFVYHLKESAIPRSVVQQMQQIEDYTLANHQQYYVPPNNSTGNNSTNYSRRDPTKFQSWGGYW